MSQLNKPTQQLTAGMIEELGRQIKKTKQGKSNLPNHD